MEGLFKVIVAVLTLTVVACFGLTTYAVLYGPNPQYCRSGQWEAKTNLSGLFTAEKAFFGEYSVYSTDLLAVNWKPDGAPRYIYGFRKPGGPARIEGITDLDPTRHHTADPRVVRGVNGADAYSTRKMVAWDGRALGADDLPETFVTSSSFVAAAAGDGDSDGDNVVLDVWTINQVRTLTVVHNDCFD